LKRLPLKVPMPLCVRCVLFGLLLFARSPLSFSQVAAATAAFPDAPSAVLQAAQAVEGAAVRGVVRDTQGTPLAEARVELLDVGMDGTRTAVTGDDGAYVFEHVAAGEYRISATIEGFVTYTSEPFAVKAGEPLELPPTALRISTSTTVDVHATSAQIAEEEVKQQEKQRVLGIFQNFYTSYIWNAQPMPAKLKYKLALRSIFDPVNFASIGISAGIQQARGTYPSYGDGIGGYGTRYAADFGGLLTGRLIGSAILPALFHQDPRYFYRGSGDKVRARFGHALLSTVVARGDNGKLQPAYARLLGSLASGAISNTYHPDNERGVGLTFSTFAIQLGERAGNNLVREFVLKRFVHGVPKYANGKVPQGTPSTSPSTAGTTP
jgi:hypothetical protein